MASVKVYKLDGSEAGTTDLNDAVFNVEPNEGLVHEVVVALQASRRQGNAETKTRTQVSGGGKKPYRQKGTGNARHGSTREPQMRGGGIVAGPHKRSYRQDVPALIKRKALSCALSARVRTDALCVLDSAEAAQPKTKPFAKMVAKVAPGAKRTLIVVGGYDRNVLLSTRNIPSVQLTTALEVNALDVVGAQRIVVAKDAVAKLEERLK